ncbi:MAG: M48 family metallopeptidase [Saprospiraceae bacterium]|nr:M48 family metallopeptidase [Saprospiraceae bacterium]
MAYRRQGGMPRRRNTLGGTVLIALVMVGFALCKYYGTVQVNPVTKEKQRISMTIDQEIAIGLQSAPSMANQHGGLHPDRRAQELVKQVGQRLVDNTIASISPYKYDFHLLRDQRTVNAFALPGGQIFITAALYNRLESEDQLAGVLGHEIGHVIERHSAERMAKQELIQGLTGAAVMATYDPYNPATQRSGEVAKYIGNLVSMKFGRDQELESDDLGVRLMIEAGYQPEALIGVMKILKAAGGGQRQPEFASTHPDPENRVERIQEAIDKYRNQAL